MYKTLVSQEQCMDIMIPWLKEESKENQPERGTTTVHETHRVEHWKKFLRRLKTNREEWKNIDSINQPVDWKKKVLKIL